MSQLVALHALNEGRPWVEKRVRELVFSNRQVVMEAVAPLANAGIPVHGGDGAIYLWAGLPRGLDDLAVCRYLIDAHGVCVIPGSACGMPGHIRVAYANLPPEKCSTAAARLRTGLTAIIQGGQERIDDFYKAESAREGDPTGTPRAGSGGAVDGADSEGPPRDATNLGDDGLAMGLN